MPTVNLIPSYLATGFILLIFGVVIGMLCNALFNRVYPVIKKISMHLWSFWRFKREKEKVPTQDEIRQQYIDSMANSPLLIKTGYSPEKRIQIASRAYDAALAESKTIKQANPHIRVFHSDQQQTVESNDESDKENSAPNKYTDASVKEEMKSYGFFIKEMLSFKTRSIMTIRFCIHNLNVKIADIERVIASDIPESEKTKLKARLKLYTDEKETLFSYYREIEEIDVEKFRTSTPIHTSVDEDNDVIVSMNLPKRVIELKKILDSLDERYVYSKVNGVVQTPLPKWKDSF